jgi:hypothetical protein
VWWPSPAGGVRSQITTSQRRLERQRGPSASVTGGRVGTERKPV